MANERWANPADIDPDEMTAEDVYLLAGYPPALAKACVDNAFDYALGLRTGEVIRFTTAKFVSRKWVQISGVEDFMDDCDKAERKKLPFPFDRGVDIRVSDIEWVADCPYGS